MLPSVAIVGRPNVGKSTLFNQLTRSRDALVGDEPGVTRDRQYGIAGHGKRRFIAIDTGGLADEDEPLARLSAAQTRQAEAEADLILFMVDARAGMSPLDEQIAARLRRYGKHVAMLANKVDGLDPEIAVGEFHHMGLGTPWPIAARHGRGIAQAMDAALDVLPAPGTLPELPSTGIRVAVIGRPNVGKSTLVNRILDADRVIAHEQPGTTRGRIPIASRRRGRD